jgi:hypothetical protein
MFLIQYSVKDRDGNVDPYWETKGKALTLSDAEKAKDFFAEDYDYDKLQQLEIDIVFRIIEE